MTTRSADRSTESTIVELSLGDAAHAPPAGVRQAMIDAVLAGDGGYLPRAGDPSLRAAAATKLAVRNGIPSRPEDVTITTGASLGIFAALAVLCRPGDAVLLPDPCFPLYRLVAETQRLRPLRYPIRPHAGYEPDWDTLTALAGQARALIWNFPGNPTGTVADPAWLPRLFDIVARNPDLYVISDEVYEDLVYDGQHVSPAAHADSLAGRFISAFSFSKSYGMTGARVGYLHAPAGLATPIARAHWGASMSTPTVSQRAALAALQEPRGYFSDVVAQLVRNRDTAVVAARAAGLRCHTPQAGLFLWLDVTPIGMDSLTFVRRAAAECGVLLSPGALFGSAEDRVRLSFGIEPRRLAEGMERITRWLVDDRGLA